MIKNLIGDAQTRKQILITFFVLALYRLGAHIPLPGIDQAAVSAAISRVAEEGSLLSLVNLFSGGTLARFSVLGLGVLPYISAWEVVNLLTDLLPSLNRRMKESPWEMRGYLKRLAMWLTIPLSFISGASLIWYVGRSCGEGFILFSAGGFRANNWLAMAATLLTMTGGTMLSVWLADLIEADGIGSQGVNLLVFSGIPSILLGDVTRVLATSSAWYNLLVYLALLSASIFLVVVFRQAQRRVPVMYPSRLYPGRTSMPAKSYLPIPMMADFAAAEYAQSLLLLPGFIAGLLICAPQAWLQNTAQMVIRFFSETNPAFWLILFWLTVLYTFFLTEVNFTKEEYADKLRKQNAFIPSIRPGAATQAYLLRTVRRLTPLPALLFGLLVISPWLVELFLGIELSLITGTALIFLVSVVLNLFFTLDARARLLGYTSYRLFR